MRVLQRSTRPGWAELRVASTSPAEPQATDACPADMSEEAVSAEYVDPEYYASFYEDVARSGIVPATHYATGGWREGRNPNHWFETNFYLTANPDVKQANVNPLWHYVTSGRREGRLPSRRMEFRNLILKRLVSPAERTRSYVSPHAVTAMTAAGLAGALAGVARAARLVLSISHDAYIRHVGGTQIFISDEQQKFAAAGAAYLHLSPVAPALQLAPPDGAPCFLRLILDGQDIGCIDIETFLGAFAAMQAELPARRMLVVHCALGHRVGDLVKLYQALRPARALFWLHDYSTICEGLNLLRNDVEFCGAPPPQSEACRICIYGATRPAHLDQVRALFNAIPFEVVAPSAAAMAVWRSGSALPVRSQRVVPHAAMVPSSQRRSLVPAASRGTPASPIRIAFVGHAVVHKGSDIFAALIDMVGGFACYRFYHLSEVGCGLSHVTHVQVRVTAADRDAMRVALQDHSIDLVLVLSNWPETFSFVTYEAIAAGADVIALGSSGNVAAEIMRSGRGIVADDVDSLVDLFVSRTAVAYARLCAEQGSPAGHLDYHGTSAAASLAALDQTA